MEQIWVFAMGSLLRIYPEFLDKCPISTYSKFSQKIGIT